VTHIKKWIASGVLLMVAVYAVLLAAHSYTGGDWLCHAAFPIVTLVFIHSWLILLGLGLRISKLYKAAAVLTVLGVAVLTVNPWVNWIISNYLNVATRAFSVANLANIVSAAGFFGAAWLAYKLGRGKV
jgi:hypothetical protein